MFRRLSKDHAGRQILREGGTRAKRTTSSGESLIQGEGQRRLFSPGAGEHPLQAWKRRTMKKKKRLPLTWNLGKEIEGPPPRTKIRKKQSDQKKNAGILLHSNLRGTGLERGSDTTRVSKLGEGNLDKLARRSRAWLNALIAIIASWETKCLLGFV